ncbi:MAG: hypothetical protein HOO85_11405 [Methylotenera sp.]|nr:hypothetical protein [Methylotenera sp.]
MMKSHHNKCNSQRGGALIIFVLVLVLAGSATLFSLIDGSDVKIERDKITALALSEAKAALIGRAVSDVNHPGSLPCPDGNNDGIADPFGVGNLCPSNIGRLPWKSLGISTLIDGAGESLWYAISQNYRDHISAEPINSTALGGLVVDGVADQIAIVFAPGQPLNAQVARPSNSVGDYLEAENADGDMDFNKQQSLVQNDQLITIGRAELASIVSQRILREIRGDDTQGMQQYFNNEGAYPYADGNADGNADVGVYAGTPSYQAGLYSLSFNAVTKSMLLDNGWFSLLDYSVSATQDSAVLSINGKNLSVGP